MSPALAGGFPIHCTTRQVPVGILGRKVLDGVKSSKWGWLSRRQFDLTSFFPHKAAARAGSTGGAPGLPGACSPPPGPLSTKGCGDDTLGWAGSLHRGTEAPVQVPGVPFREVLLTSSICKTPRSAGLSPETRDTGCSCFYILPVGKW